MIDALLKPWYESLKNPQQAQQKILKTLLEGYRRTAYGEACGASEVGNVDDFQSRFPVVGYEGLKPYYDRVASGDYGAVLPRPVAAWVMTRGSTGRPKVIPVTEEHLDQILVCGARELLHFVHVKGDRSLFNGEVLNLNFPSSVGRIGGQAYGYSSGTYARINSELGGVKLVPLQEEIDTLGSGITRRDWEARFELVYRRAKDADVKWVMGVSPVLTAFARYVKREHGVYPADLWDMSALFATSVPKIHVKYGPVFRRLYGDVPVREIYSATEGVFAQQLDDYPYVSPNYDTYFLEVMARRGPRMLHEMRRGDWGRLVVSSCLFPRYDMGDIVECMGRNYFRIFGRATTTRLLEYRVKRLFTGWAIRAG